MDHLRCVHCATASDDVCDRCGGCPSRHTDEQAGREWLQCLGVSEEAQQRYGRGNPTRLSLQCGATWVS